MGDRRCEAGLLERMAEPIPLFLKIPCKVSIKRVWELLDSRCHAGLKRGWRTDIQQIVHRSDQVSQSLLRDAIPDTPSGDAEGFRIPANRNRSFAHAGQCCETDMLATVVEEILVNLVGEREEIVAFRHIGDVLKLSASKHFPGWVPRRVHNDGFRPRSDRTFKFVS